MDLEALGFDFEEKRARKLQKNLAERSEKLLG